VVRCIGMDVHRDFCEVAVAENGGVRSGPRVLTTPEDLEVFAHSLSPTDHIALENTGLAASVAEILRPHVERVVVANPQAVRAIAWAKVKTDRVDARTLAKLLASGFLPEVWPGDQPIRALRRRISRRAQLVRSRTRAKNEVHAVLQRNLVPRPPVTDLFGTKGRAWLQEQALPPDEARTIQACLRQIAFFEAELGALDADIAAVAVASEDIRRLMTIPGVDVTTASTLMAAIGHIGRFPTARHLVGYLGLDPGSASPGPPRPGTGRSPSRDRPRPATSWWRRRGCSAGPPARCGPSSSGWQPVEGPTWRPWRWPASWSCSAGTSCTEDRTTRSLVLASPGPSSGAWSSSPGPSHIAAGGAGSRFRPPRNDAARSPR
jgi:transposase